MSDAAIVAGLCALGLLIIAFVFWTASVWLALARQIWTARVGRSDPWPLDIKRSFPEGSCQMNWAEIEASLLALLPSLAQAGTDAATGEGGLQKVVKVMGDLTGGVAALQSVVAAHPAVTGTPAAKA